MANPAPATEPIEQANESVLRDIGDPLLFQAVLTRLKSMLDEYKWRTIAETLASLSPRSFVVALAAGEFTLYNLNASRLQWMLHGPKPYILNHPTMMHEVRELDLDVMQILPSLHHFTSLRKLNWTSCPSFLPDDAFTLLRQHVTGLQDLFVDTPRLTTPMLNDIAHMMNLESLNLISDFTVAIPTLSNLRGLKTLRIWDVGRRKRNKAPLLPSTLEGLTCIETLELITVISNDLSNAIPTMLPLLRYLRVYRRKLSQNARALLKSHYENKEGFKFVLY